MTDELQGALMGFVAELREVRNLSPHTVAAYRRDVRAVLEAVGLGDPGAAPIGGLTTITRDHLLAWLYRERRGPRAATSTARRLAALRGQ